LEREKRAAEEEARRAREEAERLKRSVEEEAVRIATEEARRKGAEETERIRVEIAAMEVARKKATEEADRARRLADEERHRADQEIARMREEAQRAEEARRAAEEARKAAEELRKQADEAKKAAELERQRLVDLEEFRHQEEAKKVEKVGGLNEWGLRRTGTSILTEERKNEAKAIEDQLRAHEETIAKLQVARERAENQSAGAVIKETEAQRPEEAPEELFSPRTAQEKYESGEFYPLSVLQSKPKYLDWARGKLELLLKDEDFYAAFKMSRGEFLKLPPWKQSKIKIDLNLY
jgi:hypothetical protein